MLAHRVLGQAYMYRGQYEDASAEFQKGVELSRNDPVAQAFLARAYAVSGRKQDALKILEDLQKLSAKQYVPPVDIAAAYAALDAKDLAFQWLNRGYENRSSFLAYLKVDRAYDSLRSDPRFAELLKRMNLA